jgi:hypothetical protein
MRSGKEKTLKDLKKRGNRYVLTVHKKIRDIISVACNQSDVEKIAKRLLRLRSALSSYDGLTATVPKTVLNWINYGRETFNLNQKLQEDSDSIEYGLYYHLISEDLFWQAHEKALYRNETKSIEDNIPRILVELKKIPIPNDRLTRPIKGLVYKSKLPTIVGDTAMALIEIIGGLFPPPQQRRIGRTTKKGPGLYQAKAAKVVATLIREVSGVKGYKETNVYSKLEYKYSLKKRGKTNPYRAGK